MYAVYFLIILINAMIHSSSVHSRKRIQNLLVQATPYPLLGSYFSVKSVNKKFSEVLNKTNILASIILKHKNIVIVQTDEL